MTAEIFCRILMFECGVAPGAHVLAAVSGGADSVAMLCLLDSAREIMDIRVSAAHVEHGVRGEDSVGDMAFVRDLCMQKKIGFYARRVDAPAFAREMGCGVEAAARELRYAFLEETREAIGADVIAVAHHAGDQAETVLMHAARGSDLRGLCAMHMSSARAVRPLLGASAEELRAYLREMGQTWREDATNADPAYARNRIRSLVLPELERAYPGAQSALSRLALSAQRDEDFFSQQIAALEIAVIPLADGAAVETAQIRGLHDALLSRVLVRLIEAAGAQVSGSVVDRLIRKVRQEEASAAVGIGSTNGQAVQVRFGARYLCVTRPWMEIADIPLSMEGETHTPFGTFVLTQAREGETGDGITSQTVPVRLLEGARVTVRREGDVMIPFGQHTPVKLKKLLIDSGVERAMRRSIPVVRSKEGVFWLPGLRPGEACRAGAQEKRRMIVFKSNECIKI